MVAVVGPPLGAGYDYSVGTSIPANMAHAVSVSLPRWQDNVDYEEGRLTDVMQIGYPRFFVHKSIQKLSTVLLRKFGTPGLPGQEGEACFLFPSARIADRCRSFIRAQSAAQDSAEASTPPPVRVVQFSLVLPSEDLTESTDLSLASDPVQLYIVLFPASKYPLAKSFWQHTGDGISSRLAEHCLTILEETGRLGDDDPSKPGSGSKTPAADETPTAHAAVTASPAEVAAPRRYSKNRHYARGGSTASGPAHAAASLATAPNTVLSSLPALRALQDAADPDAELVAGDHMRYVEERYGRNLPANSAALAKRALKRRIAGTLLLDRAIDTPERAGAAPEVGPTARSGTELSEDDVFLHPTGMSAIFRAHQTALRWRRETAGAAALGKSVCFGFPYTDTLKILQKWGPGCHFFGQGDDTELDDLEALLKETPTSSPPILALFCEFPSNPLLKSPDLARIRRLADEYGFLVVVDETIGNFLNVEVLPFADMVVSSLTKVFSGDANVMGGSLVLNPRGRFSAALRSVLVDGGEYEDTFWGVDAVFMERNSRDFAVRVEKIDANAEALATMLHEEMMASQASDAGKQVIKGVYYPKYVARRHYDACRRKVALPYSSSTEGQSAVTRRKEGGYGGLFSIIFTSMLASQAFYDALSCAKGPSLGTNFTLASPYTLLAHYTELDWAKQFGVESTLVRVSTGLEDTQELVAMFRRALDAAQQAEQRAR
ncbi:unnamed protein product [Parajaminaea phylloscopi]